MVKSKWLEVRRTKAVEIIVGRVDLLEKVKESSIKDDEVVKAMEKMKWAEVKMLRNKKWKEVDGIIYKKEKVYVPKDDKLRAEIIRLYHNKRVQKGIAYWDKQNNDVLAPNCILKVWGEIIKDKGL